MSEIEKKTSGLRRAVILVINLLPVKGGVQK